MQTAQQAIFKLTEGASGEQQYSVGKVIFAGIAGAVVTPLIGKWSADLAALFARTPEVLNGIFNKIGQVITPDFHGKRISTGTVNSSNPTGIKIENPKGDPRQISLADTYAIEINGTTEVFASGKLVFTSPPSKSMTIGQAEVWYRDMVPKIETMVNPKLDPHWQAVQAFQLRQQMQSSALAALVAPETAPIFVDRHPILSLELVSNKLRSEKYAGDPLEVETRKVYSKLEDARFPALKDDGCFVAGTLVWTDKGLVPIEQIKVGDMVLSQPEAGGERAYKPVTQTFVHEDKRVMLVKVANAGDAPVMNLVVTPNHPFWISGKGWTPVDQLYAEQEELLVQFENGEVGIVWETHLVSNTPTKEVGCVFDRARRYNYFVDVRGIAPLVEGDDNNYLGSIFENYQDGDFRTQVYNLEVADFHTYYVGELGVWVHNKPTGQGGTTLPPDFQVELRNASRGDAIPAEFPSLFATQIDAVFPQPSNGGFAIIDRGARSGAGQEFENNAVGKLIVIGEPRRVSGLVISNAEYAMVMRNADRAVAPQVENLVAYEGFTRIGNIAVFVDRKTKLPIFPFMVNIPSKLEAAQQKILYDLWGHASALRDNPTARVVIALENPAELAIARQYLLDPIVNAPNFGGFVMKPGVQKNTELALPATGERSSQARLQLIKQMIDSGRLRYTDVVSEPQYQQVEVEGSATTASLTLAQINALLPTARQYWLAAGASAALLNSATFQIADLPTGLAGQTQGKAITLDASGSGWGWFIDSTPTDQAEFDTGASATSFTSSASSANGAGSQATGKLDLLTVLIHELGHIVGLPSTPTANDVMSQYLAPGQRRLPDAVDIAALQAKGSPYFNGNSVTLVAPPATYASALTYSQLHPVAPVVNPTFTNGSFTNAGGTASSASPLHDWEQAGVVTQQSSGTVTLGEAQSSAGQTRLAQTFVLNAKDRFLTFTVNNLALQNNSSADESAPQDAFEVALLNANTGTSLWTGANAGNGTYGGTSALSKTDALLSLQLASSALNASVQERTASVVSSKLNTDGSRTYLVDLRNIAAGNSASNAGIAVNLSFDLIGFGTRSSGTRCDAHHCRRQRSHYQLDSC